MSRFVKVTAITVVPDTAWPAITMGGTMQQSLSGFGRVGDAEIAEITLTNGNAPARRF